MRCGVVGRATDEAHMILSTHIHADGSKRWVTAANRWRVMAASTSMREVVILLS